ncbi:response regulator receiver domain [Methylorubrum rhodesianum]|uniref:response regulator receiver domain n=1 Tax=Methylorubrum rhodesianum TaxID=29427 RepID=UPI003D02434F
MPADHYSAFLQEAFIDPIRSVLIIDDDYPTYEEILNPGARAEGTEHPVDVKQWRRDPEPILKVIRRFRSSTPPLLVDIHDGFNVEAVADVATAAHLHQSDFLVLDFQLDRSRTDDGTQAIAIIRQLARNDHFNLVLVHTQTELDVVFEQVCLAMLSKPGGQIDEGAAEAAGKLIDEDADKVRPDLGEEILTSIGRTQYLASRYEAHEFTGRAFSGKAPFGKFKELLDEAKFKKSDIKTVLDYAVEHAGRKLAEFMVDGDDPIPTRSKGDIKWLKTGTVFVAFCRKNDSQDLMAEMLKALNDWRPPPSRLYLAKLRAVMDDQGMVAQELALGHKHALAHWYDRLLRSDARERQSRVAESVQRHSDELLAAVLRDVIDYANRLVDAEIAAGDIDKLAIKHFDIDLQNDERKRQALLEHNAFVCSKPRFGWHLTTGHVFTLNGDHWICLSPACDTVPTQLTNFQKESFGSRLPFTAVKLNKLAGSHMLTDVNSNRYVFLRIDGEITCFGFDPKPGSAPYWRTLYAENEGELKDWSFDVLLTATRGKELVFEKASAHVVSQLRYEYALNLIQRLGISLTRIGLDFAGLDRAPK